MLSFGKLMEGALNGIAPVALLVGFGALIPAVRLFKASDYTYFSNIVFKYTFPISIIYTLGAKVTIVYEDLLIIGAYFGMIAIVFALSLILSLFLDKRKNIIASTVYIWSGSTLSNCVVVGVPLATGLFGEQYTRYCFLHMYPWGSCLVLYYFMYELWTALNARREEETREAASIQEAVCEQKHELCQYNSGDLHQNNDMSLKECQTQPVVVPHSISGTVTISAPKAGPKSVNYGRLIAISICNAIKVPTVICLLISLVYLVIGHFKPQLKNLPESIAIFFKHLSNTVTPMANLMMGMYAYRKVETCVEKYKKDKERGELAEYKRYMWMEALRFCILTLLRNFVAPLIMMGLMFAMKLNLDIITANTILAATPTGIFCFVMSDGYSYYGLSMGAAAIIQCFTMFLTVPVLYYICMAAGGQM